MNNIGFIGFAYSKIRYILNAVLKCESIYLAHVLFYFISNVETKSRIPKNGAIEIFYDSQNCKRMYSHTNFQPYSMK